MINLTLHKAHAEEAASIYADTFARYGIDASRTRKAFRTLTIENAKAGKAAQDQVRDASAARFNAAVHGRAISGGKGAA